MGHLERHRPVGPRLDYQLGSYGFSRLRFRGPRHSLDAPFAAFVGGTETFGKFLPRPFPALVEARTGIPCINFGIVNAGLGAHLADSAVMAACHDAAVTVVEVMGAHNLSNRLYKVHPRRNDRFVAATPLLTQIYGEVDFADFVFTRHMLAALHAVCPRRFELVLREVQRVWVRRMEDFARELPRPPVLLWLSRQAPEAAPSPFASDPLFVTSEMLDRIRPLTEAVVEVCPGDGIRSEGREGMVFSESEAAAAAQMLGPAAHEMAARALAPLVAARAEMRRRA